MAIKPENGRRASKSRRERGRRRRWMGDDGGNDAHQSRCEKREGGRERGTGTQKKRNRQRNGYGAGDRPRRWILYPRTPGGWVRARALATPRVVARAVCQGSVRLLTETRDARHCETRHQARAKDDFAQAQCRAARVRAVRAPAVTRARTESRLSRGRGRVARAPADSGRVPEQSARRSAPADFIDAREEPAPWHAPKCIPARPTIGAGLSYNERAD